MGSRSKPLRKAARRVFSGRFGGISYQHVSAHAGTEEGDSKDGGKKVRVCRFLPSVIEWFRGVKAHPEPIFEADFQPGSYGYRPKRTAHEAVARVAQGIVEEKTRTIDLDLSAYFDNVRHSLLLEKVARRVQDDAVMHLLKMILQATGKKGVPQGGVITA